MILSPGPALLMNQVFLPGPSSVAGAEDHKMSSQELLPAVIRATGLSVREEVERSHILAALNRLWWHHWGTKGRGHNFEPSPQHPPPPDAERRDHPARPPPVVVPPPNIVGDQTNP